MKLRKQTYFYADEWGVEYADVLDSIVYDDVEELVDNQLYEDIVMPIRVWVVPVIKEAVIDEATL